MNKIRFSLFLLALLFGTPLLASAGPVPDVSLADRLKGRILLQVEEHGEAWYVRSSDAKRYYMKDGAAAYAMMRYFSLGISDKDLATIPSVKDTTEMNQSTSACLSNPLAQRLAGNILLQVEQHGKAWYVDPAKCRSIYLADGSAAYTVMRYLGLGIANQDLEKISVGEQDKPLPSEPAPSPTPDTTSTSPEPTPSDALTCILLATPSTLIAGEKVTLSWKTTGATNGSVAGEDALPVGNGSITVIPNPTIKSYKATFFGSSGSVDCETTIRVSPAPKQPEWHTTLQVTDNDANDTAFSILGTKWRVTYTCQGYKTGNYWFSGQVNDSVGLYASNLPHLGIFANYLTCPAGSTTTTIDYTSPGQYRLDINSNTTYNVTIEDYY